MRLKLCSMAQNVEKVYTESQGYAVQMRLQVKNLWKEKCSFMTRKVFICSGIISQIRQCRTKEPIYFLDPTHLGPSVLNEIKDLTVSIVAPKTDQCRK